MAMLNNQRVQYLKIADEKTGVIGGQPPTEKNGARGQYLVQLRVTSFSKASHLSTA